MSSNVSFIAQTHFHRGGGDNFSHYEVPEYCWKKRLVVVVMLPSWSSSAFVLVAWHHCYYHIPLPHGKKKLLLLLFQFQVACSAGGLIVLLVISISLASGIMSKP